jgi:ribosomal protein L11 methyltransferase
MAAARRRKAAPHPRKGEAVPIFKTIWTGPKSALESAETRLTEILFPPAEAVSLVKSDDALDDAADSWRLEAYFGQSPDTERLAALLKDLALPAPAFEQLEDRDWVAHALEGLGVVRAGRFVLYGSHDRTRLPNEDGDIPILIEANQAFGTGHHPTTAGCLTLLDRLAGVRPERILDLGAGSAVLAIAAAKLWDRDVIATDIDRRSVEIAAENAALNGVGDRVDAFLADGFDDARIAAAAPFDFIFANILAGPLIAFAPAMARHMARSGRLLLAGLMAEQEAEVTAAYEAEGFRRLNRLDHAVWPVLLFARL